MFLSDFSVKRPVAMSCLIIGLTLLGINAWRKMGLELLPKMDMPFVTVTTVYPGASPEQIETDVAKRIEDQVMSIDGLKHVSSSCMENVCQTFLEFELGVDVDIAAMDVREKIDLVRGEFPSDVEDPKILKFDVNAKAIVTMALAGDVSVEELYDFADNTLRDRISTIPGVADVTLIGGEKREVHVLLDREKLAARGLTSMDVVSTIQQNVRTIPSGRVKDGDTEYSVKFDADYSDVARIGDLEIANRNGQRCYLRDVGSVEMTTGEMRQLAEVDGRPAVAIKVIKKADANAVEVVTRVRKAMDRLESQLPGGMELVWVTDDATFTAATNWSAWSSIGQGIVLTAAILFIFLYNLRVLLVVVVTMPLTVLIGLFFMYLAGYTLNNSTLMSLGMSVGILVTNSIVVIEAIVARLEKGAAPMDAARIGSGEAFIAVFASALTNIVVLFPMANMDSMVGLFIGPFAMTMLIVTVVSLFISFTLTPMLCSLLLKPSSEIKQGLIAAMESRWNRGFDRFLGRYKQMLLFFEKRRWASILMLVAIFAWLVQSMGLAGKLGSSMVDETDRGEIYVKLEFPTRYSIDQTVRRMKDVNTRLEGLPHLRHTVTTIGKADGVVGQSTEGVYLAQVLLRFNERTERKMPIRDLVQDIRNRLADCADATVTVSIPSTIGGQSTDIEMEIAGDSLDELDKLALNAKALCDVMPGVKDVNTTVREGKPEIRVYPRRAVLSDLRTSATALGMTLRGNLEGIEAGTFKKDARNYDIVVKFEEEQGRKQVDDFLFPGTDGMPVLLSTVGTVEQRKAPIQITRKDKRRVSKLLANLSGIPIGTAVQQITGKLKQDGHFPPGYDYRFAGTYEKMAEGQIGLLEAMMVAIVLVILTLAAIMESWKQPWLILVTIPLALIGMFWALYLSGYSIGIFVLVGAVMLIGIVVNNAILIMDQFNVHIREGVPRHKAMMAAATEQFRPVMMITIAAVLGMLPMALSQGIGAEMRNSLGMASAGGILVSGILTMLVMPVLYDLCTRRQRPPGED